MAATIDIPPLHIKSMGTTGPIIEECVCQPSMSVLAASAGAYVHQSSSLLRVGIMFSPGLGSPSGLFMTRIWKEPQHAHGDASGICIPDKFGLGPSLADGHHDEPLPGALRPHWSSSAVFACFTGAALSAPDGKYLSQWHPHVRPSFPHPRPWPTSSSGFQILSRLHLYIGPGHLLWVHHVRHQVIRKARNGDKDFIAHSLDLFILTLSRSGKSSSSCRRMKETSRRGSVKLAWQHHPDL